MDIDGTVALVTGGQRGLGAAFATELLARGAAKVYVTAREPKPSEDPRIVPIALEVTNQEAVDALPDRVPDVSLVINNAGLGGSGVKLLESSWSAVEDLFDTNVYGPLRITRALAPVLAGNGGGTLVNVHSVLSWLAGSGAYGATKAALWSLSNSLRLELAGQGTSVIGVHLGLAETDMTAGRFPGAAMVTPRFVATQVVDGIAAGVNEVLVDDVSRQAKAALSGPVEELVVRL